MVLTDKIETTVAYVYYEGDFLRITFKEDSIVELAHMNEIIEARKKIQQGKKSLTLVDMGKLWRVDKDARQRGASQEMVELNSAIAIIAKSLANRLLGNFYIHVDKPDVPSKMCSSEEEAVAWLNSLNVQS